MQQFSFIHLESTPES